KGSDWHGKRRDCGIGTTPLRSVRKAPFWLVRRRSGGRPPATTRRRRSLGPDPSRSRPSDSRSTTKHTPVPGGLGGTVHACRGSSQSFSAAYVFVRVHARV